MNYNRMASIPKLNEASRDAYGCHHTLNVGALGSGALSQLPDQIATISWSTCC